MDRYSPSKSSSAYDRGYATLLILVLFATFSAYGLEMLLKAHLENTMIRRELNALQAMYIAEGGVEWVKANLKDQPDFPGGRYAIGGSTVEVQVDKDGENQSYQVISKAQYGSARRRLNVRLEKVADELEITEYQELYD